MKKPIYNIRSKVWLYPGMAGWHLVSISKKISKEIKELFGAAGKGFGSIPVVISIAKTNWKTSIFPDKKTGTYVLPLKTEVRKKEGITNGNTISFSIEIRI